MRFHTKEWRRLMMNVGLSSTIKKIPDGHYSDEEIQKLYDEKAKERPAIENFPQNYECNIVGCVNIFPQWLLDEVDHRLIAMEYLPETAYDKFLEESKEYARQWNAMNNAAEEFMKKEKIPEKIAASMCFSQASLVSLKNDNSDLEMIISKDSLWEDGDDSQYRKIIFKKVEVLEKEEGIDDSSTNPMLLDEEIHISDKGFVFYMTFETAKGFAYLTVECQDVQFTNCDML